MGFGGLPSFAHTSGARPSGSSPAPTIIKPSLAPTILPSRPGSGPISGGGYSGSGYSGGGYSGGPISGGGSSGGPISGGGYSGGPISGGGYSGGPISGGGYSGGPISGGGYSGSGYTGSGYGVLTVASGPPELLEATSNGDLITLSFDSELGASNPSSSRFAVTSGGKAVPVVSTAVNAADGLVKITLARALTPKDTSVAVSYTDLKNDQTSGVIEGVDGSDLASFKNFTVIPQTEDSSAPVVSSAAVDGALLTLQFDEALGGGSLPSASSFTVTVNGRPASVASVSAEADAGLVTLKLAKAVQFDQTVELAYRDLSGDQTSKVIQDEAGNDLATFSKLAVVNNTFDPTPLDVNLVEVDGDTVTVSFDKNIKATVPSASSFRIEANGKVLKVTRAATFPDDRQVVLTLASAVESDDSVTFSYIDAAGDQSKGAVEDLQGNDLVSITKRPVKNITPDLNPLSLESAQADGNAIALTFSKPLATTLPTPSRFTLLADGKKLNVKSISSTPADGVVTLNLAKAIPLGVTVQLDYSDQTGDQNRGVIEDLAGNDLASIKKFSVTNFVLDEEAPNLIDATVDGKELVLFFDEVINPGKVLTSAFRVEVGGKRAKISGSSVSVDKDSTEVVLMLNAAAAPNAQVEVSYTDSKGDQLDGVIQDLAGNDLESLRRFSVENIA